MAKRRIMTGDAECLYKVCRKVDNFDKRLAVLLDDMAETMYDAEGVGLAAPQVGILKRCLSFPGERGYVVRPNHVRVRAMNRFGEECEYDGDGLFARAILHETDHLNGLVYKRLVTEAPEGYDENEEDE